MTTATKHAVQNRAGYTQVEVPPQACGDGCEASPSFRFVQELAEELSRGTVELPGFPDVAQRVQRALADPRVTTGRLLRIVSVEPVLAARIVRMANSAALARSAGPIVELGGAINRLGFDALRSIVIGYALDEVRRAPELRSLAEPLHALWQRSVLVATLCRCLAQRNSSVNPDTAMLAGLLHAVGRLYILVRSGRHPQLFSDPAAYQSTVREWHAPIAQALLENWGIPDDLGRAVAECEDVDREHRGTADLTDVLAASCLLATHRGRPARLDEVQLQSAKPCVRLGLTPASCEALLQEAGESFEALRDVLSSA